MLNFLDLVLTPPESSLLYQGNYDPVLVSLSIIVAILASYASLRVSQYASTITTSKTKRMWIAGGGLCLGLGTWAMHFVGMLAFSLPCSSDYDPTLTFLSIIPSILASTLAIKIISRSEVSYPQLATGGLLIGAGIGAMHYSGMAAMQLNGMIRYDIKLFSLSILIAVALTTLALWIKFGLKSWQTRWNNGVTIASAVVMGLAVSGMHYTAMAAAYFIRGGDTSIVTSGTSPAYLASIVLVATSLIIVVTIVTTYFSQHNEYSYRRRRPYKFLGLLILGWIAVSWLSADHYFGYLSGDLLKQESQRTTQKLDNIADNINESLELLKGVGQVLSHDTDTTRVLRSFGENVAPSPLVYEKRKQHWSQDKVLVELSRSLGYASTRLGADIILIVNAAGDCVASSNVSETGSLVGFNFADRLYFQQARAGQQGHQYLVGRATSIPGLYFSNPVYASGRFVGAVVVKREVKKLANWTKQANVFITDANGVIVMAPDKQYEFRYMPNSPAANLSTKDKTLLYKRTELEPLKLTPWGNYSSVVLIDGKVSPVVFISKTLAENAITIYVYGPMDELARFGTEKYLLFFLLAFAGNMLIIAASAIVIFLRESQKMNMELRIAASAFESDEGILVTNANNEILRVNRTFTTITGYTAEEAIGKTPRILSSGKHNADFFVAMWDSLVKTGAWEGDIWNKRKNGENYPEHLIITALKDNNGIVTNYVSTFSDITERIRAEAALQESHQQMFSLLNSMAEGAYGVDINGYCTFVNRSFLRILGFQQADEIIGKHIHTLIHHSLPDGSSYPASECKMYKAYRRNQEIHVSDEVFWTKEGIAIPVEYWSQPIMVDEVMQGAIATFIDVTERRKLEAELKESELRYRTVADYTSDWEYWIMPDNTFRYVSPSSEQVCGYTPDEFYADPQLLKQIIHPDDLQLYAGHIHNQSTQRVAEPIDFRIRTKGGEIRWISHVCRPVFDSAGGPLGQRASNRDISDRKAAEEQIRNLAFYDALTQLPNRRLLNDRLGQTMAASKRSGHYGALMFLDLDNFKPLNDTYGHSVGDLLLIEVARRISSCVREVDTVARFGGDEFVVMLTELDVGKAESASQASIVAEKIRALLAEHYLLKIQSDDKAERIVEHHCTSSIGVVLFINHEAGAEDIFKWADMAMYQAKNDGRNLIRFFDPQADSEGHAVEKDARILRLSWDASYYCGEPTIDREHQELFELANVLIDFAFTRNENPQGFDSAMRKLLAHVVQHFADEEAILARNNYIDLDDHARAHKVLIERVLQLHDKAIAGEVTVGEWVNFLANDVVSQHMLKMDRKFYSLFNKNQPF